MMPGMGNLGQISEVDENKFKPLESIIHSMTPQERTCPNLLDRSRRTKIAKGSGIPLQQVNSHLKQFDNMRKMMHKLSKGGAKQLMKNMLG